MLALLRSFINSYFNHAQAILRVWVEQPALFRKFLRESQPGQALLCMGLGIAVAAVISTLHRIIELGHEWVFQLESGSHLSSAKHIPWPHLLIIPALGGLMVGVVAMVSKRWRPREIVDPIEANATLGGRMSMTDNLRLLSEALISNIAGASVGMEAAYTQIGSGLMSWLGQRMQLRREDLRIFVAAGAAAAIAAAFNAPLAGAFYGFELVLGTYTIAALPQVALAALSGALFVRMFTNDEAIFSLSTRVIDIPDWNYPLFFLLGIVSALLGITTMKMVTKCEHIATKLTIPEWLRPALGGILVAVSAMLFPQVLGSGQGAIDEHLNQHWPLMVLVGILFAKMAASAVSIGTGFRGGLFSSALFLGCLLGQIFGILAGVIFSQTDGQLESFMLVGMGAVAASIVGAPITMVMLVLELTGNFPATTGVLLGVLVSSAITRYAFGYSFSTWRFHLRGLRIHSAQDIGWVGDITVDKLMFHDAKTVTATTLLEQLRQIAPAGSAKRLFVMDAGDDYQGMIDVPAMHHPDLDKSVSIITAQELAKGKEFYLLPGDNIQQTLRRFEVSELEELPVLASLDDPKVIGYVSEAYVLRRYSQELESRNMAQSIAGSPASM